MTVATSLVEGAAREHLVAVGRVLRGRRASLTRSTLAAILLRIPELDGDAQLVDLLTASIDGNVGVLLAGLESGLTVTRFEPPAACFEHARRLAQRGIPVNALVRSYRIGQRHVLESIYAECFVASGATTTSTSAYEAIVEATFDYVDWISQTMITIYEYERREWASDRDIGLVARVDDVLSGAITDVDRAEDAIRHRLRGSHRGAVIWVDDPNVAGDQLPSLAVAASALAEALGSNGPVLVVARDASSAWVWVGVPAAAPPVDVVACEAAIRRGTDGLALCAAIGGTRRGIDGFRRTHREALAGQRVTQVGRSGAVVVSYEQPGLDVAALLSRNLDEARDWVGATLRDLARDDEHHERLRQTVRVLLRHDGSYTATGEAMQLHRNSVRYRVQCAEKAMGRSLHEDRQSIDLALTACHWLGVAVLVSAAPTH